MKFSKLPYITSQKLVAVWRNPIFSRKQGFKFQGRFFGPPDMKKLITKGFAREENIPTYAKGRSPYQLSDITFYKTEYIHRKMR